LVTVAACLAMQLLAGSIGSVLLLSLFFALFTLESFDRLEWLALRPLVFLGTISYSLYLIHEYLGYSIINRFENHGMNANIAVLCMLVIAVATATALNKLIEIPANRAIRATYKEARNQRRFGDEAIPQTALSTTSGRDLASGPG
jgi:peptidoglycan/LPS O-acetylase OafA/YrhL